MTTDDTLTTEMLEVAREASRLAREGGTPEQRAAHDARKAALLSRIEATEAAGAARAAERSKQALRDVGAL